MDRFAVMETFIRVVESRSFTAAAKHLCIGQPCVSKSIAHLEKRLGVRLLVRSTRGLKPTEAGQNFYERACRAIAEANEAELAASSSSTCLAGRVRASAPVTLSRLHIVPQLERFLAEHPSLSLDLVMSDQPVDMVREGVDMALRAGVIRDSALVASRVATCRRLVVGAPAYLERHGVPKSPTDLVQHAAIILTTEQEGVDGEDLIFRQNASAVPVTLSSRLRVSTAEAVRTAVLAGIGLAIVSEWMFAPELASGAVCPVLDDWVLPAVDLWTLFPTGRMVSARTRAFADFVAAEFRKPRSQSGNTGQMAGFRRPQHSDLSEFKKKGASGREPSSLGNAVSPLRPTSSLAA